LEEIDTKIIRIIASKVGKKPSDIMLGHYLYDLGANDDDIIELATVLEDEFDIEISDEDLDDMETVQDFIDYVLELIQLNLVVIDVLTGDPLDVTINGPRSLSQLIEKVVSEIGRKEPDSGFAWTFTNQRTGQTYDGDDDNKLLEDCGIQNEDTMLLVWRKV